MIKLNVLSMAKTEKGKLELPVQFNEEIRPDLIKRAVEVMQANSRQRYGAKPDAGKRSSAEISRRRHNYRGSYGFGISRVPRKIMSRRGTRMNWTGAFAPGTVGGRRAHPPKAEKQWSKKININERRKAIRSAMAASLLKDWVSKRGHKVPENYPFFIEADFENISKTKQAKQALVQLGFKDELVRCETKQFKSGVARLRGRKYRRKKGLLLVVSKECALQSAAQNLPGVDIVEVNHLNTELLAPGAEPGRLTLFTESAARRLGEERLFFPRAKKKADKKEKPKKEKKQKKAKAEKKVKKKTAKPAKKKVEKTEK